MNRNFVVFSFVITLIATSLWVEAKPNSPNFLVISCSLNPNSHSALLAEQAVKDLKAQGQVVEYVDLRKYKLPLANGHEGSAYDDPQVKEINDLIAKADGIIIASPIHNASVTAATKNLLELTTHEHKTILTGKVWKDKVVGFMGASYGKAATYGFFPFINSLIIDGKVLFIPAFVMANHEDFNDKKELSKEITERIEGQTKDLVRVTSALKQ